MNKKKEAERLAREVLGWSKTKEQKVWRKRKRIKYEFHEFDKNGRTYVHYQDGRPMFAFSPFDDWWSAGLLLEKLGITPEQILREKGIIE